VYDPSDIARLLGCPNKTEGKGRMRELRNAAIAVTAAVVALVIFAVPVSAQTNELHLGSVTLKLGMPRVTVEERLKAEGYRLSTNRDVDENEETAISKDNKITVELIFANDKLALAEHLLIWADSADAKKLVLTLLNLLADQTERGNNIATVTLIGRTFPGGGANQNARISFVNGQYVLINYLKTNDGTIEQVGVSEGIRER
jgi:hypothetical protein